MANGIRKENRLYPFVSPSFTFVSQRIEKYSDFYFQRTPLTENSVILQDIEKRSMAFERELFVPVRTTVIFVCISERSKIQCF